MYRKSRKIAPSRTAHLDLRLPQEPCVSKNPRIQRGAKRDDLLPRPRREGLLAANGENHLAAAAVGMRCTVRQTAVSSRQSIGNWHHVFHDAHRQKRSLRRAVEHRQEERVERDVDDDHDERAGEDNLPEPAVALVEQAAVEDAAQRRGNREAGEYGPVGLSRKPRMSLSAPCSAAATGPNSMAVGARAKCASEIFRLSFSWMTP